MMKNKVMLSVIVPVYNVAPYLRDCLDSLLAQGFSEGEYEVIVVDDGSTDSSREIIQKYARENSCIHCIHQSNAGVSAARNTGLDKATGEYVAFVDGDDFLVAGALKIICDKARCCDADILTYGYMAVEENAHFQNVPNQGTISFTKNQTGVAKSSATVWASIYRQSILSQNELWFPVGIKFAEDSFFSGMVSMFVNPDKQFFCDCVVYCYRQRSGSAMHSKGTQRRIKHMHDMICAIDAWEDFLKKHSDLSEERKNNIGMRRYLLAAAACFDALRSTETDPYEIKKALEARGVYPYPRMKYLLNPPRNIANIIKYFLNNPVVFFVIAQTGLLRENDNT